MSMSRHTSLRALTGPWKRASAAFTPRYTNWGVSNYRNLSTILSPQWQRPPSPQRQLIRYNSQQEKFPNLAEDSPSLSDDQDAEFLKEPVVRKFNGYLQLDFTYKNKSNQYTGLFGEFWLRDNCQCSKCIHPDTKQRAVDTFAIPKDVSAEDIQCRTRTVDIKWSDGHLGVYPGSWLLTHQNDFTKKQDTAVSPPAFPPRDFKAWRPDSTIDEKYPTVQYDKVMENDRSLCEWLEKIYEWGFCFVKGVPVDPEQTKELIERIAFIRHTHYGGFWDFTADLSFKDTAYTTEFLGAHTDNTYFTDPARLQLFHLLSHTDGHGGESLLVDGFRAAEILSQENPEHSKALRMYRQPFHSSGNEDTCIQPIHDYGVFSYHPEFRRLYQVRWNNYDRAAKRNWGVRQQEQWYDAARHFDEITKRPEMEIWTQLEPGTALIFDNWRMLHGRSEFVGKRRMCGGYVNNDDFLSRYRLLKFGRRKVLDNLGNPHFAKSNPFGYF